MVSRSAVAYTLTEMLIGVLVLAALAAVLAPRLVGTATPEQLEVVVMEVATALRHARNEALRTGQVQGVEIDHLTNRVTVFAADLSGGGIAVGQLAKHPSDQKTYQLEVGAVPTARGAEIRNLSGAFQYVARPGNEKRVLFDREGFPFFLAAGTRHALASGTIRIGLAHHEREIDLSPRGRVNLP